MALPAALAIVGGVMTPHLAHLSVHVTVPKRQWGMQNWEYSTLRTNIHEGRVSKVAVLSDESAVEVVDVNGLARQIPIFPEATPPLIAELRAAHVDFEVLPAPPPASPPAPLARALVSTFLMIAIISALGMTEQLRWGVVLAGMYFYQVIEGANYGVDVLIEMWHAALHGSRRNKEGQHAEGVPVPIEADDQSD
eukprot:19737-Prymnesium_polylepis.1